VPNAGLRDQVQGPLAGVIAAALGQVLGQRVRVAVAILPGGGRPAEGPPTLARVLAGQRGA